MWQRCQEVQSLLSLTEKEVREKSGDRLLVCKDLQELHERFAKDIFMEILQNNRQGKPTRIILPVLFSLWMNMQIMRTKHYPGNIRSVSRG